MSDERKKRIGRRAHTANDQEHPAPQGKGSPLTVQDLGWSQAKAAEIRASLLAFEEDWNAPGMEAYDSL